MTRLFIHGTIALPEPVPVVATVKIKKTQRGRYGLTSIARIPQLLEGSGSLLAFRVRIERRFEHRGEKHGYLTARCFDGKLSAKMIKAVFRHEGDGHRTITVLSGTVIRPCTPSG